MKKYNRLSLCLLAMLISFGINGRAEESVIEKVETSKNKAVDSVKGSYRASKDKACKMIHGKLECLGKKIKNQTKDVIDKSETKSTEIKDKVD